MLLRRGDTSEGTSVAAMPLRLLLLRGSGPLGQEQVVVDPRACSCVATLHQHTCVCASLASQARRVCSERLLHDALIIHTQPVFPCACIMRCASLWPSSDRVFWLEAWPIKCVCHPWALRGEALLHMGCLCVQASLSSLLWGMHSECLLCQSMCLLWLLGRFCWSCPADW